MATLQRIRNHSVALLVIVGLAMAAFIIGDLLTSSSNRDKVVTVNGKKVTYEEFETERNRKQEFIKAMYNQDLDNEQLTQQVYNEFVTKLLLNEACEETGLAVTPGEVNEMVQGAHTATVLKQLFGEQNAKPAGQYFTNLIVNDSWEEAQQQMPFATQSNWAEIEDQIKLVRTMEKYNALVSAAVKPNKLEAEDNFAGDNEQATFEYVRKSAYTVADSLVKVSDSDLKDYYQATKRLYKNPDMVSVAYIAVPLHPSQADYQSVLADMETVKEEFKTGADISDLVNSNSEIPYLDAFVRLNTFEGDVKTFVENGKKDDFMEPALQDESAYVRYVVSAPPIWGAMLTDSELEKKSKAFQALEEKIEPTRYHALHNYIKRLTRKKVKRHHARTQRYDNKNEGKRQEDRPDIYGDRHLRSCRMVDSYIPFHDSAHLYRVCYDRGRWD